MLPLWIFTLLSCVSILNCQRANRRIVSGSYRNRVRVYDAANDDTPWVWGSGNTRQSNRPTRPSRPSKPSKFGDYSSRRKDCGTTPALRHTGRIVGGREAFIGEFPWHVGLMQKSLSDYQYFCGGAILNEHWIVTAAHCLEDVQAQDIKIVVATHELTKSKSKDEYLVDKLISHQDYRVGKGGELINDIALLHVSSPIDLRSDLVNTVCLPHQDEVFYKNLQVSGWGRTHEHGLESDVLRTAQVFVHGNDECAKNLKGRFMPKEMFCAGIRKGGRDACRGDSGGPIVKRRRGKSYLAGVVSFGVGCAREGLSGVYTRLPTYVNWIQERIK